MKVTVYHKEHFGQKDSPLVRVAEVNAPYEDVNSALEYAYRWTNNICGSWSRDDLEENGDYNENVTFVGEYPIAEDGRKLGARSTSMFDIMACEGNNYEVAAFGFREVA